jgi:hypothetical protein
VQRQDLGRRSGGFGEQAVREKDVGPHHARDADRAEGIEVHQARLDVLDAALTQRVQRPLAGADDPLGADRAVELVLDLQQARGELAVLAPADDRLVCRVRRGQRTSSEAA